MAPWVAGIAVVLLAGGGVALWAALRSPVEGSGDASPVATGTRTPSSSPTPSASADPWAGWTLEEQVGQVFMVGVDVTSPAQVSTDAVVDDHVGNLFLHGRTRDGAAPVRALVDSFTARAGRAPLLVATDQEGGRVQVLQGPGFSAIPSALDQASTDPANLRVQAATWGAELAAVGVDLDLAPVMDLVDGDPADNPPVGALDRAYGFTPQSVTSHAEAFSAGMRDAGVETAIKHFPGLGRVDANPDTTADVTDTVTTRDDAAVGVFRDGIEAGARYVMVSTAVYERIDPDVPAAFSSTVVTDLLRGDLRFDGVVVTDDLSGAEQVADVEPGERAVRAIEAGVDLVLVSKVPDVAHEMVEAVVERARDDDVFAAQVRASAERVLRAKGAWPPAS